MNNPRHQNRAPTQPPEHIRKSLEGIRGSVDQFRNEIREKWNDEKKNKWPKRAAIASIASAIVTLVFVVPNFYQTYLNVSHFSQAQRAFVVVNKVQFTTFGGKNGDTLEWTLNAIIENNGNTPTRNLKVNSATGIGSRPFGIMTSFKWGNDPQQNSGIIGPKGDMLGTGYITGASDLAQISSGRLRVGMAGVITYDDIFGGSHKTEFCFEVYPPPADFEHFPIGQSIKQTPNFCPKHNCADQECVSN